MVSVLMTVYEKEDAGFFRESLRSMCKQTLQADEIVLVKDGPLGSRLEDVILEFAQKLPMILVSLPKVGHSGALRAGIERCRGDIVAKMDSDDISLPHRLRIQVEAMRNHPEVDVVGGAIAEFVADPAQPCSMRRLPGEHNQILQYAKFRNPLNHMTVMFRREAVLRAGNYQRSPGFEDWHLWNRMIMSGSRFMNLEDVLVLARVGSGMVGRRSGLRYVKDEIAFHLDMHRAKFLSPLEVLYSLMLRLPIRLAPQSMVRMVYRKVLRSEV
jgi:glycosyltransferase involved in cell wall biosynthesis